MVQVLHIANGDTINEKLAAKGNRLEAMLAAEMTNEAIVEEAYLAALSRFPTDAERTKLIAALAEAPPRNAARRSRICTGASSAAKSFCSITKYDAASENLPWEYRSDHENSANSQL